MVLNQVCAICLDALDGDGFHFPCGHAHTFHHVCAIDFLSSALHTSRKGLAAVEAAFANAATEELRRIRCPLCRAAWPRDPGSTASALRVLQASAARIQRHGAERLRAALERLWAKYEQPSQDAVRRRFRLLRQNWRIPATFLFGSRVGGGAVPAILSCIRWGEVRRLRACSSGCDSACHAGRAVRSAHLRLRSVHAAVRRAWAPDVLTLDFEAPGQFGLGGLFSFQEARDLGVFLAGSTQLRELRLRCCEWESVDPGGRQLAGCVAGKGLRVLDLTFNSLSDGTLVRLAGALRPSCGSLRAVNLDLNCASSRGLEAMLGCAGGSVESWSFRHNVLGDEGCGVLAKGCRTWELRRPRDTWTNRSWDLRTNRLTADGCRSLAAVLGCWAVARLGCNPLGDGGIREIARAIGAQLVTLDLQYTQMGPDGAADLALGLRRAGGLRQLLLAGNQINAEGVGRLADSWEPLPALAEVDLSSNPLGCGGVETVAEVLPGLSQERLRIYLMNTECGEAGGRRLLASLRERLRPHTGVRRIRVDLSNNSGVQLVTAVAIRRLCEELFGEP